MDTPKQFAVPHLKQIASAAFAKAVSNLETPEDYNNLVCQLLTFPPAYLHRVIPEMPWSGVRCLFQSGKFEKYLTTATMDAAVLQEENNLRQKFANNPNHKSARWSTITVGLRSKPLIPALIAQGRAQEEPCCLLLTVVCGGVLITSHVPC